MAGQAPSDLNNSNNITGPQLPVKLIQRNLVIFILGSTACTLHRYHHPLQFCFLFQTYFLDLILENENCFSCPGPSTPVLSCLIQISGLTQPRVASCTPPLDVNIDVNIKDLSNYSLTWPPHCKNRSQSALWICAVLSLYSSLT